MIQLAGELADGTLGYFHSVEYVRDVAMPNLREGAARAGRDVSEIDVTAGFPSVVTRDDSGIELAKGQVMMFATALDSAPAYAESIKAAGFGDAAEELAGARAPGDLRAAVRAVPDEMANALTLSGSRENVLARIAAYRAAGLTGVMLNPGPPGGWYPLYEGHFPPDRRRCPSSTSRASSGASTTRSRCSGSSGGNARRRDRRGRPRPDRNLATRKRSGGRRAPFVRAARAAQRRRQRSELNAARTSVEKSSGSSQAAKWPPLSTSLKYARPG